MPAEISSGLTAKSFSQAADLLHCSSGPPVTKPTRAEGRYTQLHRVWTCCAYSCFQPRSAHIEKAACQPEAFSRVGAALAHYLLTDVETEPTVPHFGQNRPKCACYLGVSVLAQMHRQLHLLLTQQCFQGHLPPFQNKHAFKM